MLVSIIIPVYNTEKYLKDLIGSLINQTYKNIEMIFIDDGSTDNSLNIIKQYQKNDHRIKIISSKNNGANIARKKGLDIASGEYVMFIDSDDWIDINTVEELVNILSEYQYDAVRFNALLEPSKKIKNEVSYKLLNHSEIKKYLIETNILNNLCFTIYKLDKIKNIKAFNLNVSNCEDYLINLEFYTNVDQMLLVDNAFYHYRYNPNSTTENKDKNKVIKNIDELVFVYSKLFEYLNKWGMDSYDNKVLVAYKILSTTETSMHHLFYTDLSNKELQNVIEKIISADVFMHIRNNVNYKDILKIFNKQSISYKIKHQNIKNIYQHKLFNITLYKILFKVSRCIK